MAAYSLDLRKRVLRAWDRGMKADAIATTFEVSVAWILSLGPAPTESGIDRSAKATEVLRPCIIERRRGAAGRVDRLASRTCRRSGLALLGVRRSCVLGRHDGISRIAAIRRHLGRMGPAAIWLIATGQLLKGLVLGLLRATLVGTIDDFLRPAILSDRAQMNGLLMFISLLGGVSVFGLLGIVLGPRHRNRDGPVRGVRHARRTRTYRTTDRRLVRSTPFAAQLGVMRSAISKCGSSLLGA